MSTLSEYLSKRHDFESQNEFYLCETCSLRFSFSDALDQSFVCPTCSSKLNIMDNSQLLNSMKTRLDDLRDQLEVVSMKL